MFGIKPKGGMFGATPSFPRPIYAPQEAIPVPQPQRGGFNAPGGLAEKLGLIGDTLLGRDTFTSQVRARQQQAMAEQMYQQRRQDTQTDWLAQQEYERAHPKPVNNDTVADFDFISKQLGPDMAKQYLTTKATAPPFVQHNADGTITVIPAGMAPRGATPSGPAPGTIEGGYRFKGGNAADPSAWEPVGGAGAAAPARFP